MDFLNDALARLEGHQWALTSLQVVALIFVVWLANLVTRSLLVRGFSHAMRRSSAGWDDALVRRRVFARLANVVPALVIYYGIGLVSGLSDTAVLVVRNVASAYVVLTIVLALANLLSAFGDIYERRNPERARERPIKGYLQVVKIIAYLVAGILVIATLFNQNPLLLLSGLGAMTAVLLLVFKDTILSLVASVQLSSNDMLRVGDWIAMPQLNADGDVVDISLHTVKVQNWDKTITMIPTWRLISESYINWRAMFESGGRKMQRSIYLDQTSVRFVSDEERKDLRRFALIHDYLDRKHAEIEDYNEQLIAQGKDPVNSRRVTNVGTFRAYVQAYIESHSGVNAEMFRLVRQLQSGPTGLPLEIYCYTASTAWADYEGTQGDIFDHLYSILPEFGLRVFQQPSGADIKLALAANLADHSASEDETTSATEEA